MGEKLYTELYHDFVHRSRWEKVFSSARGFMRNASSSPRFSHRRDLPSSANIKYPPYHKSLYTAHLQSSYLLPFNLPGLLLSIHSFLHPDDMSVDPYHAVRDEIQSTLANASTLLSSFRRIRAMVPSHAQGGEGEESEETKYARSELKATLSALEADLEELEESVKSVFNSLSYMLVFDSS